MEIDGNIWKYMEIAGIVGNNPTSNKQTATSNQNKNMI